MRILLQYFQAITDIELVPGIVAIIQTSGQKINFRPHIHLLATEGREGFEWTFHHLASSPGQPLAEFFEREVFALPLRHELASEALAEKISGRRHSGF